jgi:hypothetical protein
VRRLTPGRLRVSAGSGVQDFYSVWFGFIPVLKLVGERYSKKSGHSQSAEDPILSRVDYRRRGLNGTISREIVFSVQYSDSEIGAD